MKKEKRGGKRAGSGAKQKYGEPTVPVVIRVPGSKVGEFRAFAKGKLIEWELNINNN